MQTITKEIVLKQNLVQAVRVVRALVDSKWVLIDAF